MLMPTAGESSRFRIGLGVAAVVLGLLAVPLIRGQVLLYGDLAYYYIPLRAFFASCLAAGEDPSWCPSLFGGFFLYGEGGGIAHPLIRVLYGILPLATALNVEMLAAYPALFAGLVVLLARWGVRRDAAAFGGVLFAFGGYNLLHFHHLNVMAMLAHVPWLLLAIDVSLRASEARHVALARVAFSLLTASQILMAHVQFAWISAVAEASYALFVVSQVPGGWRRLAGLAVSKALGVLGGAAQIVPLRDAFIASKREQPSATFVAMGSLPPVNLLQWVAPYLTVSRVVTPPMAIDGGVLPPAPSIYDWRVHEFAIYYGAAIPALLIWLGIDRKALGRLRPLALLATLATAGSLLLALGDYTPLFSLTTKIPVVGRFRIPARYLVITHLALATLGALAFARLSNRCSGEGRIAWRRLWPLLLPPALSVVVTVLAVKVPEGPWPSYLRGAFLAPTPYLIAGPLLVGLGTALVACAARGSRVALVGLLAFTAADQFAYAVPLMVLYPPQSLARFVEARQAPPAAPGARVTFKGVAETWQNAYTMRGLRLIQGYAALVPRRRLTYDRPATLRVGGVSWVMPPSDNDGKPFEPAPDPPVARARLVTRTRASTDPNRDIDAIDVATTALVDRALPLTPAEPGRARLVGDRPGKLDVVTEAGTRQLLVISESHHDGWRVRIDGHTRPLLRVNGDFLGCVVPGGKHHVQFRFRPSSPKIGAWLSGLGLVLMTLIPFWPRRRGATAAIVGAHVPASHLALRPARDAMRQP
jgi:hypothetical protein